MKVLLVGGPANGTVHELPSDHVLAGKSYHLLQYMDDSPRTGDAMYQQTGFRDLLHNHIIYAHIGVKVVRCQYDWTATRELELGVSDKQGLTLHIAAAINRALHKCFVALEKEEFTLIPGFHIGDATEGLTPMPGFESLFRQQMISVRVECLVSTYA